MYALVLVLLTAVEWRASIAGVVAILQASSRASGFPGFPVSVRGPESRATGCVEGGRR